MTFPILVVDDNYILTDLIDKLLNKLNFSNNIKVNSSEKALNIFKQNNFGLVITDINMPIKDGFWLLENIKKINESTQVIIVTGLSNNISLIKKALQLGACDFLEKPIRFELLKHSVTQCFEKYTLLQENIDYQKTLELKIKERTNLLKLSNKDLNLQLIKTVEVLTKILEVRDYYIAGHSERVTLLAVEIAKYMNLSESIIHDIRLGSQLHDIGKVFVPIEFLSKHEKLSDLEFAVIKTHAEKGYNLIKTIPFRTQIIANIVRQHHERLDGSGYPQHLKGDEILLEAQIVAVADTLEAISFTRNYRKNLGIKKVMQILKEQAEHNELNKKAVTACLNILIDEDLDLSKLLKNAKTQKVEYEKEIKCWDYTKCNYIKGRQLEHKGICPAYPNYGDCCALVEKTKYRGRNKDKCLVCDFYRSPYFNFEKLKNSI